MIAPIEEGELKLLAYLADHAVRYHDRLWLDPKPVIRSLGISAQEFAAESAHLVAHGLAGVRKFAPDAAADTATPYCAIWLTGKGEDYMGALRAAQGLGPKRRWV